MPFNLNAAPAEKPSASSNFTIENGLHECTVEKVEYATSTNGNPMLSLRFKVVENGTFIFDQIMDDQTKPMNLYKLSRIIKALGLKPTGSVELKDMTKIIRIGSRLVVAAINVTRGSNNYVNVDFSNSLEGYYPIATQEVAHGMPVEQETAKSDPTPKPNLNIVETDDIF